MANPDSGNENIENLYDGNVLTKWLDYSMRFCGSQGGATLLVHGISLDEEPVYFNFATGNDDPNRDPTKFEVTVCTLVDTIPVLCKTLYYELDEDEIPNRSSFLPTDFSTTAYTIEMTVIGNNNTVVLRNMSNTYGDELTFTTPGTKTFLYQVPQGSRFDISVWEQPYGQSCTVSGVYQGSMTADVELNVYCIESCDGPGFVDDLVTHGFPTSLAEDLCVVDEQYYWKGQPLCVAAADYSAENDTCPFSDRVCAGPLGKTYGGFDMQAQVLLEAFGTTDTCKVNGEACHDGLFSCCDPMSECLWRYDPHEMDSANDGFFQECTDCGNCDPTLQNCNEICTRNATDPIYHPRCPPSTCEVSSVYSPEYFEDDIEYCINGLDYYMNGMAVCVPTDQYVTEQDQNVALGMAFTADREFGTDDCSQAKSFDLLMQDHLYIAQIRLTNYQEIVDNALAQCCLEEEEYTPYTNDWRDQISYLEGEQNKHGSVVDNNLRTIISKLETLLATLGQL